MWSSGLGVLCYVCGAVGAIWVLVHAWLAASSARKEGNFWAAVLEPSNWALLIPGVLVTVALLPRFGVFRWWYLLPVAAPVGVGYFSRLTGWAISLTPWGIPALLHSHSSSVRKRAVERLGRATLDKRNAELLSPALVDATREVRQAALTALAGQQWTPATKRQEAQFAVASGHFSKAAVHGNIAVEAISVVLSDSAEPAATQAAAVEALGTVGTREAAQVLIDKLSDIDCDLAVFTAVRYTLRKMAEQTAPIRDLLLERWRSEVAAVARMDQLHMQSEAAWARGLDATLQSIRSGGLTGSEQRFGAAKRATDAYAYHAITHRTSHWMVSSLANILADIGETRALPELQALVDSGLDHGMTIDALIRLKRRRDWTKS